MIELYDFTKYPENDKTYGGNSGSKLGIDIDGESWMLKFPKSTAGFRDMEISYTTSPLSEYIGSKVYEALEIPVHETRLGVYHNKVVVACKDFLDSNGKISEFEELKNRYSPEMEAYLASSKSSDRHGIGLDLVEKMFQLNPALQIDGLENRFWDMFIVDALIGNVDRNNGNWGIIKENGKVRLAPVYDNGNAFRNKASDRQLQKTLLNPEAMRDSAYRIQTCYFEDLTEKKINPHKYISEMKKPQCNAAVLRITPRIQLDILEKIIWSIPNEWNGHQIISDIQKEYSFKVMEIRYKEILIPTMEKIKLQEERKERSTKAPQKDTVKKKAKSR